MKNVVFENCRLDFATFDRVRTTGPVAFLGCALNEAAFSNCKLNTAVFDGCNFTRIQLDASDLRGADLRGNDLSRVAGVNSLRGAILSEGQLPGLTHAVIRDLGLAVKAP